MIAAAIGNDIVRQDLSTSARVVAMSLYVVIGSIGILIPIIVTVVRPDSSDAVLFGRPPSGRDAPSQLGSNVGT